MTTFMAPVQEGALSTVPRYLPSSTPMQKRLYANFKTVPSSSSLLKTGGVYVEVVNPSQTQIAAADLHYQGGRVYTVDDAEALALATAGYISGLGDGYGVGFYGNGTYGG